MRGKCAPLGKAHQNFEKVRDPHWGVLGMQERIEALGGRFTIESHAGQGTSVLLRVPLS
jgi:signal transduction histidine kinase